MNNEKPPTANLSKKPCDIIPQSRNRLFRTILIILCLILCTAIPTKALAGKEYRDTRQISRQVIEIQKKYGMPVEHDKGDNPWYAISGSPRSITLYLFKAEEIPQQAILDIVKLCMDLYEKDGRKGRYGIEMYHESFESWQKSLFFGIDCGLNRIKPYFVLTIGRKNK